MVLYANGSLRKWPFTLPQPLPPPLLINRNTYHTMRDIDSQISQQITKSSSLSSIAWRACYSAYLLPTISINAVDVIDVIDVIGDAIGPMRMELRTLLAPTIQYNTIQERTLLPPRRRRHRRRRGRRGVDRSPRKNTHMVYELYSTSGSITTPDTATPTPTPDTAILSILPPFLSTHTSEAPRSTPPSMRKGLPFPDSATPDLAAVR
ncbi:hypothetical protein V493_04120 [Pseudogymnoascus sp. VKM F-4281 (FW-2241)]|nr:hypothetical protein V493_04120 [Pseudogymnoascus sp. VKM F-4281 (FW-2241)]